MTNLDVSIRARFVNQMGDGTRRARGDIDNVGRAVRNLERTSFASRMSGQFRQVADAARRLGTAIRSIDVQRLGTIAAGITTGMAALNRALAAPAQADADFMDVIIDIAQKAELGKDKIGGLADEVKTMADRLRSSPLATGKGIDVLMGAGLDLDVSRLLVTPIQKVAKAYRVETAEVSKAVFSMVNNLKVAPADIEVALGRIAQAAADGRYEVKDFAAGLPTVAATLQKFNQTGLKGVSRGAALLETVAGVAGEPGQATTWVEQMLDKAMSPDVVRNFAKKGVKIDQRIRKAMKVGGDINEVIYAAIMEVTKGDATKLVDFYGDEQARNAAVALMQNIKKYRELRDKYDKITSPDKLNTDLEIRTEGSGAKFRTFADRWQAFQESVGKGLNLILAPAVDLMGQLLDVVTRLAEAFPRLTGSVTLFGASLAAFGAYKTAVGVIGGLASRLGIGSAAGGAGGAAAAGAGAGGAAAIAGRAGFLSRMMPWLGRAGMVGLGIALAAGIVEGLNSFKARSWTMKSRGEGEERLSDLRTQLAEIDAKIAAIETRSKVPEMAQSLTQSLKTEKAQIEAEIRYIEEQMNRLGALNPRPEIDTTSIDKAIERTKVLRGELQGLGSAGGSSFMGNVPQPKPRPTVPAAPASPVGRQSRAGSTVIHQHIYGGDSARVARLAQREQERAIRSTRMGALHEGWSWA